MPPPASRLALLRSLQRTLDPVPSYPADAPAATWLERLRASLALDPIAALHPDQDNHTCLDDIDRLCQAENLLLQDLSQGEEVIGKVLVTTYHAAKGREFDTVILPGLLNGIIPRDIVERGRWRRPTAKERAEQRRAFYVALTRAERTVHLIVGPGYHTKNGYWIEKGPSDFVVEMARSLRTSPQHDS